MLKRGPLPKGMESRRTVSRSSYKSIRTESSSRESQSSLARRSSSSKSRQQNSNVLHKETRWDSQFHLIKRSYTLVERQSFQRADIIDTTVAVNNGELSCGFSEQTRADTVGVSVIRTCVRNDSGSLHVLPYTRHVCESRDSPPSPVHVMVPGHSSSGTECSAPQMGPSVLRLPSSPTHNEGTPEDTGGETGGDNDSSQVAICPLVATFDRDVGVSNSVTAQIQDDSSDEGFQHDIAIPGTSSGSTSQSSDLALSVTHEAELKDFLSHHLAEGTKCGYRHAFARFKVFCSFNKISPKSCKPEDIAKYLKLLCDKGASYNTINVARSAISKYHNGFNGVSAGSNNIVCMAMRAVFRIRPPLPKYKHTYDVTKVLDYLKSLPPNTELTLKQLSMKTLFLLIMSTISRVSSVSRLGPELLVYKVG